MATVILPLGYPLVSGAEDDVIIYQGNVARMYQIPTDPRTDAQLNQRRQLYDVSKMSKSAGVRAKSAFKSSFGSRWSTIIYQFFKLDYDSSWTDAQDSWAAGSAAQRAAWDAAAPFQATYNEPGLIFFGLVRVIYSAMIGEGLETFDLQFYSMDQSSSAATWWALTLAGILQKIKVDDTDPHVVYAGGWSTALDAGCFGGSLHYTVIGQNGYGQLDFVGRRVVVGLRYSPQGGEIHITVDQQDEEIFSQNTLAVVYQRSWSSELYVKGLHRLKIWNEVEEQIEIDWFNIFGTTTETTPFVVDEMGVFIIDQEGFYQIAFEGPY